MKDPNRTHGYSYHTDQRAPLQRTNPRRRPWSLTYIIALGVFVAIIWERFYG